MIPSRRTIVLLLAGCCGALAVGGQASAWAFILLLNTVVFSLLVVDWVFATRQTKLIEAARWHANTISVGRTEKVVLVVRNLSTRRAFLSLVDALAESNLPAQASFPALKLAVGGQIELTYRFTPQKRGSFFVGPCVMRLLGPLGLAWRQTQLIEPTQIKVYPDIKLIERYQSLLRQRRLVAYGLHPTRQAGEGTSFESLREFVTGDDPGKIEWKITAKKGKPIVKNYQAERSQSVYLLLDTGKNMSTVIGGKSRLDYAVDSALLLGHVAISRGDNVGLILFADKVKKHVAPNRSTMQVKRIADALFDASSALVEPDYMSAMRLATLRRRRSLLVIFTDLWGRESAEELAACVRSTMPVHLPLVVMMRDREMETLASNPIGPKDNVFRAAAACQLLQERSEIIAGLRSMGALVLDIYPQQVTSGVISKYLEVKLRNLL